MALLRSTPRVLHLASSRCKSSGSNDMLRGTLTEGLLHSEARDFSRSAILEAVRLDDSIKHIPSCYIVTLIVTRNVRIEYFMSYAFNS